VGQRILVKVARNFRQVALSQESLPAERRQGDPWRMKTRATIFGHKFRFQFKEHQIEVGFDRLSATKITIFSMWPAENRR
jgi:hypothetical protein